MFAGKRVLAPLALVLVAGYCHTTHAADEDAKATAFPWTFEDGAAPFGKGKANAEQAYTGKKCLASEPIKGKYHDAESRTGWRKEGYGKILEDPHVNLAIHADKECSVVVVVEGKGKKTVRKLVKCPAKEWSWHSLPLKGFETVKGFDEKETGDALAGMQLSEIAFKGGKSGMGLTFHVDDVSVSKGKTESPKKKE